jgi:ribosomal protein L37AE/L43A
MPPLILTALLLGLLFTLFSRYAPRCPECGSLWATSLRIGIPIWVCERCQTVWRVR